MSATVNRRAVLCGAAAMPLLAMPVLAATSDRSTWAAAVAKEARLWKAHDDACTVYSDGEDQQVTAAAEFEKSRPLGGHFYAADTVDTYNARQARLRQEMEHGRAELARRFAWVDELNEACDRAADAHIEAYHELMNLPAPGLPEVVFKLELAKARDFYEANATPIIADLRRIGGAA